MAKRVEFKLNNGIVKNMERPLAMRLESRKIGKIIGDVLTKEQELIELKKSLDKREKELAKREKALTPPANKVDKQAAQRHTK